MLILRWSRATQEPANASVEKANTASVASGPAPAWAALCDHLRPGARRAVRAIGTIEAITYECAGLNPAVVVVPGVGMLIAIGTPSRGGRIVPTEGELRAWLCEVAQGGGADAGLQRLVDCEGFYAFAYYDARTGALCVLTDRTGMVPLYRTEHDGAVWFSTSATALACVRPTRLDVAGWSCVLVAGYPLRELSLFEGVRRVRAGLRLTCTPAGVQTTRWWQPAWGERVGGAARVIAEEYVRERRATLAARLGRLPHVYGALTAGLDSRCALALVRGVLPEVEYFTGESGDAEDRAGARAVAEALGLRWRILSEAYEQPETLRATLLGAALAADGEQHPFSASVLWAERLCGESAVVMWGLGGEILRDYWSSHERARWLLKGADRLDRLVRYRMSGANLSLSVVEEKTRRTAREHVLALLAESDRELAGLEPLDRSEALYLTERMQRWGSGIVWKTAQYVVPELPLYGQRVADLALRWPRTARRGGALLRWAIELADPAAGRLPHNGGYPTRPAERAAVGERLRGMWLDGRRLARRLFRRRGQHATATARPTYRELFEDHLAWRDMHSAGLYDEVALRALVAAELDRPVRPESGLNIVVGTECVCRAAGLRR